MRATPWCSCIPACIRPSKGLELPWPAFMMEYLFDTTRAAVNLIFSGALERFPRIRFILPHAGGVMPYFAWRLSVSPMIDKRLHAATQEQVFARLPALLVRQRAGVDAQTVTDAVAAVRKDAISKAIEQAVTDGRMTAPRPTGCFKA